MQEDGIAMTKQNKIYVKIQIEKDQNSGELTIRTQFDPDAPNFYQDKTGTYWCPTPEEITFINEAFELIPTSGVKKKTSSVKKRKEEETFTPAEEEKEETFPEFKEESTEDEHFRDSDLKPLSVEEPKEERVIVSADEKTVDDIINRKRSDSDDDGIIEADEETIIDKVLKQKKKGKL